MSKYRRKETIRLKGYDYSNPGAYYITICVKDKKFVFGEIINGEMILNISGSIVKECWHDLPKHYKNCVLDEFVIMPNHFHGILIIIENDDNVGNGLKPFLTKIVAVKNDLKPFHVKITAVEKDLKPFPPKRHGLSEMVRALKTFSSRKINEMKIIEGRFQWQKSYYDHIIRDERDLQNIRQYIYNNPINWQNDRENPENNVFS